MGSNTSTPPREKAVCSYEVTERDGSVEIKITSGSLEGKSARVIQMPPSAAYFNAPLHK